MTSARRWNMQPHRQSNERVWSAHRVARDWGLGKYVKLDMRDQATEWMGKRGGRSGLVSRSMISYVRFLTPEVSSHIQFHNTCLCGKMPDISNWHDQTVLYNCLPHPFLPPLLKCLQSIPACTNSSSWNTGWITVKHVEALTPSVTLSLQRTI